MTAEKKTLEKACEDAAPLEGAVDEASSVMKFPMDFPIKVMGLAAPTFPKVVADIARLHCDDLMIPKRRLNTLALANICR